MKDPVRTPHAGGAGAWTSRRCVWPFDLRGAARAAHEWADDQAAGLIVPVALVGGALAGWLAAQPRLALELRRFIGIDG